MLDHKYLKEIINYDNETGIFRWRKKIASSMIVGTVAGCKNQLGYTVIRINKKLYLAHRLAWFYVHGKWPENRIDHINMDRSDNRISNLRDATHSQNLRNTGIWKSNTTGYRGVTIDKRRNVYRAQTAENGKTIYLGDYKTKEEAASAYEKYARNRYGDFFRK